MDLAMVLLFPLSSALLPSLFFFQSAAYVANINGSKPPPMKPEKDGGGQRQENG